MNWEILIPIFGIVGVFGMPVFIVLIVFYFEKRNKEQFHTTLQKLIESGQELSPDLLRSIPGYKVEKNGDRNDIRSGTITAAVGIGIALFGHIGVEEEALVGIGLLVFSIGLGILVYGIYNRNKKVDDSS
jgi:cbb3-type cytochrome oxidase subunit 3|tara:strand:- start:251 stop:640 length:390 start_codon:yes stop_codon:yes gene_type:complete